MDEFQIDIYSFFVVAEAAVILLVVALIFGLRSRALGARVRSLQSALKKAADAPEPVGFDQYLRDEVIRNQALMEQAAAAEDEDQKKAGALLALRKQFLELELAARALEKNPVKFQAHLSAGFAELIEQMRPEAGGETPEPADTQEPMLEASPPPARGGDASAAPARVRDTHDEEFDRLKLVINNQQDAMSALRAELKAREADIKDLDSILRKLDEFEQHDAELQQCLRVMEQENQRLKAASSRGGESRRHVDTMPSAQLRGLKSMIGNQQATIANLQNLIRELAPEASKAADLEAAIDGIKRANQELSNCVAVLEDENAMLRTELESVNAQLEIQGAAGAADASPADEKQQMEIKIQELEALVEFKDAAIEELEKQYNTLESKYRALKEQA